MSGPIIVTDAQLDTLVALAPRLTRAESIPGEPAGGLLVEQRPFGSIAVEPDGGHGPTLVVARNGELRPDDDEYGAELPPPVDRTPYGALRDPAANPLRGIPGDLAVPEPQRWCAKCARYVPVDDDVAPRHHAPDCPEYIPF